MSRRRFPKWAAEFFAGGAAVLAVALVLALIGTIAAGGWHSVFGGTP